MYGVFVKGAGDFAALFNRVDILYDSQTLITALISVDFR